MLDTILSKKHDDDLPAIVRKKQRRKKPRNKFNTMHSIPVKTLNMRENSYHGSKNGKRMGFAVYTELTCKQCKPDRFFHKREGLRLHSVIQHGREGSMIMRTSQSLPLKLSGAPTALSNIRVTRANSSKRSSREMKPSVNRRGIEIIELENKVDEDILLLAYDDSESETLQVRAQLDDIKDVDYVDDDEDIECVEIVEVGENHIKSFKEKNYKRMEISPLYQPEVVLMNSLNCKMREVNTSFGEVEMLIPPPIITEKIGHHEDYGDCDEILVLDDNILLKSSRVKRRSVGGDLGNFESKRGRRDELLLLEDESDDNDDLLNIRNLLEVTMEENEIIEVDLEPEEVDLEPEEVVLEPEEVDLEPEEVDLQPEEVEVLHLDEQNNIEDLKPKPY